jgi:hypothetical protein
VESQNSTTLPKPWVCHLKPLIRWGLGGLAGYSSVGILLGGGYFSLFHEGIDLKGLAISVLFSGFWGFVAVAVLRSRMEISENEIRIQKAFSRSTISLNRVAAYRVIVIPPLGRQIQLIDSAGTIIGRIPDHFADFDRLIAWLDLGIGTKVP